MSLYLGQNKIKNVAVNGLEKLPIVIIGTGSIDIKLSGDGKVKINSVEYTLTEDETIVTVNKTAYIESIWGIKSINVADQGVTTLEFNEDCNIEKVVCYNNNITALDISKLHNLKYLHIFNNPICESLESLTATLSKLPNRKDKCFGSVITYDWLPIPEWISEYNGGYAKYPGTINNPVALGTASSSDSIVPTYTQTNKTLISNHYYRLHDDNDKIYKWNGTDLIEETVYNNMNDWRRQLEVSLLPKHWVFGSAIQYHSDYQYCSHNFKAAQIADYWESAEKGFGITIGCRDQHDGLLPNFNELNIILYGRYSYKDDNLTLKDGDEGFDSSKIAESEYSSTNVTHGSSVASIMLGKGYQTTFNGVDVHEYFGNAPESNYLLIDTRKSVTDKVGSIPLHAWNLFEHSVDCITSSIVYNSYDTTPLSERSPLSDHTRIVDDVLFIQGTGNDGDDQGWTIDPWEGFSTQKTWQQSYNTNHLLLIGANDYDDTVSAYSSSRTWNLYTPKTDLENYYTDHGNCMRWSSADAIYKIGRGTSFATPNFTSTIVLMWNIFRKMYNIAQTNIAWNVNSNGYTFRQFITDFCNPLYDLKDGCGNGRPDIMNSYKQYNPTIWSDYKDASDIIEPRVFCKQKPDILEPIVMNLDVNTSASIRALGTNYTKGIFKSKVFDIINDITTWVPDNSKINIGERTYSIKLPYILDINDLTSKRSACFTLDDGNKIILFNKGVKYSASATDEYSNYYTYFILSDATDTYSINNLIHIGQIIMASGIYYPQNGSSGHSIPAIVTVVERPKILKFYLNGCWIGDVPKHDFVIDQSIQIDQSSDTSKFINPISIIRLNYALLPDEVIKLATYQMHDGT